MNKNYDRNMENGATKLVKKFIKGRGREKQNHRWNGRDKQNHQKKEKTEPQREKSRTIKKTEPQEKNRTTKKKKTTTKERKKNRTTKREKNRTTEKTEKHKTQKTEKIKLPKKRKKGKRQNYRNNKGKQAEQEDGTNTTASEHLPRSPLVTASASLGLLYLRSASCSGLASSMSRITAGSSSVGRLTGDLTYRHSFDPVTWLKDTHMTCWPDSRKFMWFIYLTCEYSLSPT